MLQRKERGGLWFNVEKNRVNKGRKISLPKDKLENIICIIFRIGGIKPHAHAIKWIERNNSSKHSRKQN